MSTHESAARSETVTLRMAKWLSLAAAPTFVIMALLTGAFGNGPMDMLCSSMHGVLSFDGMLPMYLLMSAFHATPWLRMFARRRRRC
ncbi:hypothetical protein [Rhodanobacter sp. L36]|uniref:hypothetical protein n=1 Tax=Rhodanobacter sp. L36 TaxID=1747221 RepID=UPI00131E96F1|nr:hypothetical protein [Rhodanobacter sp. L36]